MSALMAASWGSCPLAGVQWLVDTCGLDIHDVDEVSGVCVGCLCVYLPQPSMHWPGPAVRDYGIPSSVTISPKELQELLKYLRDVVGSFRRRLCFHAA